MKRHLGVSQRSFRELGLPGIRQLPQRQKRRPIKGVSLVLPQEAARRASHSIFMKSKGYKSIRSLADLVADPSNPKGSVDSSLCSCFPPFRADRQADLARPQTVRKERESGSCAACRRFVNLEWMDV